MKILFLSVMCPLDTRSGAARAMRTLLEWLAESGWQAYSISASLFDGGDEYPLASVFGPEAADPKNKGKLLRLNKDGVTHHVLSTASTLGKNVTGQEKRRLIEISESLLSQIQPDIVLSYGRNHSVSRGLWANARKYCGNMFFYLANAQYTDKQTFREFDRVLCPSRFLADLYRKRLGLAADVLPVMIKEGHYAPSHKVFPVKNTAMRGSGFVTFINPMLDKGGVLFWRLAHMVLNERPDLTFLCIEGRMSAQIWKDVGADIPGLPNLWWIPNQQDMRRIYQRTSILLFPSMVQEAAGRSIAEAQLGGIPVLASNRGGIPEQLNGGGFLFDVPKECTENYRKIPPDESVRPWLETICRLLDDEAFYAEASARALRAAEPFQPQRRKKDVLAQFEELARTNSHEHSDQDA